MTADDIHAFGPPPAVAPAAAGAAAATGAKSHRWWLWLGLAAGVLTVLAVLMGAALLTALADASGDGFSLSVDGDSLPWVRVDAERSLWAVLAVGAALLVMVVVVPLVLLLAAAAVTLALGIAGVAIAGSLVAGLAAVLVVMALALSPLWGVALLLWWLLRRRAPVAPNGSGATR